MYVTRGCQCTLYVTRGCQCTLLGVVIVQCTLLWVVNVHCTLLGVVNVHSVFFLFIRNLKLRLPKNFLIFEQNLAKNFLKIS